MALASDYFDGWLSNTLRRAGQNLEAQGFVAHGLYGLTASEEFAITALDVDPEACAEPERDADSGVWLLPGSFPRWATWIDDQFAAREVVAALEVGEFWRFPPDDPEAAWACVQGTGGPPSAHPRRQEGVFVAAVWPQGGYLRRLSQRIVRAGARAYLRPWSSPDVLDDPSQTNFGYETSSWVSRLLPGSQERASRF